MSDIRSDYRELKDRTLRLIDGLSEVTAAVYGNFGPSDETVQADVEKRLATYRDRKVSLENKEFSMVVIGEMKHGKSTFLNAMLRKPVFPKDVREATAAVTFLRHNDTISDTHPEWKDKAVVEFNGRETMVIEHEDLGRYTTCLHKGEINVAEDVRKVTVYTDSPFVQDGVTVVDTPGTNTPNGRHEEITYDQIDRSNAAIFLFKAGEAGKKSDFEFLETTAKKIDRFFFVVNRIDEIGGIGPDSDRIIEDIKEKGRTFPELRPILDGDRFKFFPTSGLQALLARSQRFFQNEKFRDEAAWLEKCGTSEQKKQLEKESGMVEFEEALLTFLFKGERTCDFLKGHVSYVRKQVEDVAKFAQEQLDVRNVSLEELQQKVSVLESEYEREKSKLVSTSGALTDKLTEAMKNFIDEKTSAANQKIQELCQSVEAILDYDRLKSEWDGMVADLNHVGATFSSTVQSDLKDVVQGVFRSVDYKVRGELNKSLGEQGVLTLPELMPIEMTCVVPKKVADEVGAKLAKLESELSELDGKLATMSRSSFEYENAKRRQQEIERERSEARSSIEREMQLLGKRPDVGRRMVCSGGYEEVERDGMFGWLGDWLFGEKKEWHDAEYEPDDSAQRKYDADMDALRKRSSAMEEELRKKLSEARTKLSESQARDLERRSMEQLLAKKNEQELKLRNRLREEQIKAQEEALAMAKSQFKREVKKDFDTILDRLRLIVSNCKAWSDDYVGGIQAELSEAMNSRKSELDRLVSEKESAEVQAADTEKRLIDAKERCSQIMSECVAFESELGLVNGMNF